MAILSKLSDKRVLVIDDQPGMRTQLQMSLSSAGFEKLHVLPSIREALARIQTNHYHIILCDYALGEGTNGQQFLEYLRARGLISHGTIFIMITAERSYERVVTAAECVPDDYLLKPFTAEQLNQRLQKLIERQERFTEVNRARDSQDWDKVVSGCEKIIAAKDKYLIEAYKLKGEALLSLKRATEAEAHYRLVLELRPLPWAKLGLARAMSLAGHKELAADLARETIESNDHFMGAYDFLGDVLAEGGDKQAALDVLQSAREKSPGTLHRLRNVAGLAVDTGQHAFAEEILTEALSKHKHSPVREAQDYALLSRALGEQGKQQKALDVLKDAKITFKDEMSSAVLATSESIVHRKAGNAELAEAALDRALQANHGDLPANVVAAMADACFAMGKEDRAKDLLKQMVQNNPDDAATHEKARAVLVDAGKEAEADAMIATSVKEVIQINNEGVRRAEAGQLDEAVKLLSDAADRLPNNLLIVGNAALALALDLARNGNNSAKMNECQRYRQMVAAKAPNHPKLAQIDATLRKVSQVLG